MTRAQSFLAATERAQHLGACGASFEEPTPKPGTRVNQHEIKIQIICKAFKKLRKKAGRKPGAN